MTRVALTTVLVLGLQVSAVPAQAQPSIGSKWRRPGPAAVPGVRPAWIRGPIGGRASFVS